MRAGLIAAAVFVFTTTGLFAALTAASYEWLAMNTEANSLGLAATIFLPALGLFLVVSLVAGLVASHMVYRGIVGRSADIR